MRLKTLVTASLTGLLGPGLAHASSEAVDWNTLFTQGSAKLDLRYRYEQVNQDNALRRAEASTLRSRITLQSGSVYGLSLLAEADNMTTLGGERYFDTRNGRSEYSPVLDPTGSEINQLWLRYQHQHGEGIVGRQRILLDNQRFVGGVAWRQNEQTYDGFLTRLKPGGNLVLTYAYIDQINTILGPEGQYNVPVLPANVHGHSHLVNAAWQVSTGLTLTGYHYELGLDNMALAGVGPGGQSSRTTGLRATGKLQGIDYSVEYAEQRDHDSNPQQVDADYLLAELSYQQGGSLAKLGHERLGGDTGPGNGAFQTPLATKHIFQGWADMFLITPAGGIEDSYIGGSIPLLGGKLQAWYHDFRSERGSSRYGYEVDLAWSRAIAQVPGLTVMLKGADYQARDFGVDTRKVWLQLQYQL